MVTKPSPENVQTSTEPMDENTYRSIVSKMVYDATEFLEEEISAQRERNWRYWRGESDLPAPDDRSNFVSADVMEVVESIVPQLMKIFTGCNHIVEFKANTPGMREGLFATTATEACNHIFWSQGGWSKLTDWLRDALVAKTGVWKVWSEEVSNVVEEEFEDLDAFGLQALAGDENVTLVAVEGNYEIEPVSVIARTRKTKRKYWIECIPPEEMIINREAQNDMDARIIGQRTIIRVSDAVEMGLDFERAKELRSSDVDDSEVEGEKEARRGYDTQDEDTTTEDPASWPIRMVDVYVRVDRDGDGYAEWRHVLGAGDEMNEIVYDAPVEDHPYILSSPVPVPHSAIGRAAADLIIDIADQKTYTLRQVYDNLAHANNPRTTYVEGMTNVEELLDNKFGGKVGQRQPGMVNHLVVPFVGHQSMPILEHLDDQRRWRTGVSEEAMGLNADALQSSTETGVRAVIGQAQLPVEMMARTFAEALGRMFEKLLGLIVENQKEPMFVPVGGEQWMQFNPGGWMPEMSVMTNVGLGTGQKDEKLAALSQIKATQEQLLMTLGPQNPLTSMPQYAKTLQKLVELSPVNNPSAYFNPPEMVAQREQQQQPQQDPEAAKAQAEAQADIQKAQIESQTDLQEAQIKAQTAIQEAMIKAETALRQAHVMAGIKVNEAQMKMTMDSMKTEMERELKLFELGTEAALERYKVDEKVKADTRLRSVVNGSG